MIGKYAVLNPHMTLTLGYGGSDESNAGEWQVHASDPTWRKWRPSDPTSPHWYDTQRLARLIGANVARAEDKGEPCKTVRDFLGEFRGLARNSERVKVCDAVGASRLSLDQFLGNATDLRRTGKLLEEMKLYTKPVEPKHLGAIGQNHFATKFEAFGADPVSFEYKSAAFTCDGIPYLVEAAFGYCPPDEGRSFKRRIITGINWSGALGDPLRKLSPHTGASLGELLTDLWAGQEEPITFALHIACPRVDYLDRGKSAAILPSGARTCITNLVFDVTKRWTKQRKAEERDNSARQRRDERMLRKSQLG